MEPIQVCMLGDFTLSLKYTHIRETDNRSRRVWDLLAFLIFHRGQAVSQYRLIEHLWGNEEVVNPESTLRTLLHRARSQLDQLYEGAGQECLLRKGGSYCWNPNIPLELDSDRFESLCRSTEGDRLENLLEAVSLYQGEFLRRHANQDWVIPVATYFQNLFLSSSLEAANQLFQQNRYSEALEVCRQSHNADPYFEPTCRLMMQIMSADNNPQGAAEIYEGLSRRLFDDFGILPDEETRAIYRSAVHSPKENAMTMEEVLESTQEQTEVSGALMCDYDYFKLFCYANRRSSPRTGAVTHVALINVFPDGDDSPNKKAMNRIVEQVGQTLQRCLRQGDVISRCSTSQYAIILPNANYENSCTVCRRCIAAFTRSHPRAAVRLQFLVQPLTPNYQLP